MHASTVHRVLVRHQLNRLDHLDKMTRVPIRRFEMSRPGELVHVDIKKLGRIPKGGGWRAHGRSKEHHRSTSTGSATPMSTPPSTASVAWPTPKSWPTNRAQPRRSSGLGPEVFFADQGITVERVLSDNGGCYRSKAFAQALQGPRRTPSPGPIDRRRMAKRNASTAPS